MSILKKEALFALTFSVAIPHLALLPLHAAYDPQGQVKEQYFCENPSCPLSQVNGKSGGSCLGCGQTRTKKSEEKERKSNHPAATQGGKGDITVLVNFIGSTHTPIPEPITVTVHNGATVQDLKELINKKSNFQYIVVGVADNTSDALAPAQVLSHAFVEGKGPFTARIRY